MQQAKQKSDSSGSIEASSGHDYVQDDEYVHLANEARYASYAACSAAKRAASASAAMRLYSSIYASYSSFKALAYISYSGTMSLRIWDAS